MKIGLVLLIGVCLLPAAFAQDLRLYDDLDSLGCSDSGGASQIISGEVVPVMITAWAANSKEGFENALESLGAHLSYESGVSPEGLERARESHAIWQIRQGERGQETLARLTWHDFGGSLRDEVLRTQDCDFVFEVASAQSDPGASRLRGLCEACAPAMTRQSFASKQLSSIKDATDWSNISDMSRLGCFAGREVETSKMVRATLNSTISGLSAEAQQKASLALATLYMREPDQDFGNNLRFELTKALACDGNLLLRSERLLALIERQPQLASRMADLGETLATLAISATDEELKSLHVEARGEVIALLADNAGSGEIQSPAFTKGIASYLDRVPEDAKWSPHTRVLIYKMRLAGALGDGSRPRDVLELTQMIKEASPPAAPSDAELAAEKDREALRSALAGDEAPVQAPADNVSSQMAVIALDAIQDPKAMADFYLPLIQNCPRSDRAACAILSLKLGQVALVSGDDLLFQKLMSLRFSGLGTLEKWFPKAQATMLAWQAAGKGRFNTARNILATSAHGLLSEKVDVGTTVPYLSPYGLTLLRLRIAMGTEQSPAIQVALDEAELIVKRAAGQQKLDLAAVAGMARMVLGPTADSNSGILTAQILEKQFLDLGVQGAASELVRSVLQLRSVRRDWYLSGALSLGPAAIEIAWNEANWFKGVEVELAGHQASARGDAKDITVEEFARHIPADGIAIDYAIFNEVRLSSLQRIRRRLVATVIDGKGRLDLVQLGDAAEIESIVHGLRHAVVKQDSTAIALQTKAAYELLLAPILLGAKDKANTFIVPDGALHLLPFDLLESYARTQADPAVEFRIHGSVRGLFNVISADSTADAGNALTVVAGPEYGVSTGAPRNAADLLEGIEFGALPGARDEGLALQKALPKADVRLLSGVHATETAVRALRPQGFLHVATHGFALASPIAASSGGSRGLMIVAAPPLAPNPPLDATPALNFDASRVLDKLASKFDPLSRVGLALTNANNRKGRAAEQDGVLTGREIASLNWSGVQLAVLSACDTGVGQTLDGGAVGSLARAVHEAGAGKVLYSLWPVDDAGTLLFMTGFYERLAQGSSPNAALREVKHQFQRGKFMAPVYWAGFQLSEQR